MNILNKYIGQVIDTVTGKIDDKIADRLDVSSVNSVNSFRKALSHGVALSNQFVVGFSLPSFLKDASFLSYLGVSNFDSELGLYCNRISNSPKKLKTENVIVYNNLSRTIPTGYDWGTVSVSFIETSDRKIFQLFHEWMDGINNPVTNCGYFYADSIGQIKMNLLDRGGDTKGYIVYEEAMPISLSYTDLDWGTDSSMVSVTVEFAYIYQTTRDYMIKDVYNAIADFGDSDVAQLINKGKTAAKNISKGRLDGVLGNINRLTKWF